MKSPNIRVLTLLFALIALCVSAGVPPVFGGTGGYDRPTGFHRVVEWRSDSGSARGLLFFESSAPGTVRRVLIETPAGRHLVLTRALLVRHGIKREVLTDEATGWRAELTKQSDFRADSLDQYFKQVFDRDGSGESLTITLETSDGIRFSAKVPSGPQPVDEHAAFAALLRRHLEDQGSAGIPADLPAALAFLAAGFEAGGSDARGLIEVLTRAFDIPTDEREWQEVKINEVYGLQLSNPDHLAFASDFSSIAPDTPLPAGTIEVLAQDRTWTTPPSP